MHLVAFLITLTIPNVLGAENAFFPSVRNLLTIYTFISDPGCSSDMEHSNIAHSVAAAVHYVRSLMPTSSKTSFFAALDHIRVSGCSMQEVSRASALYETPQNLQQNASNSAGFSVLLGPPLAGDCNLSNEWINLGNPKEPQRAQLYLISYYCQVLGSASVFVNHLTNIIRGLYSPPIAAVSVVAQRKTIPKDILVYLVNNGWRRIALFYDLHTTILYIHKMLNSILSTIRLSRNRRSALELLTSVHITSATNFARLLEPLEDHLDVALILARPELAVKFVVGVKNFGRIKQGRIALMHVDPTDMLTYDALRAWGAHLSRAGTTWAAGLLLIVVTGLPKGTRYDEVSIPYGEVICITSPSIHIYPTFHLHAGNTSCIL